MKIFLSILFANLVSFAVVGAILYFLAVPYIETKSELFHSDVVSMQVTIDNAALTVSTAIKNFRVFGTKH